MRQGFDGQKLRPYACLEENKRELWAAVSAGPEVKGTKSALRDAGRCRGVLDLDAWSRMPWGIGVKLRRYGRRCGVGCRGPLSGSCRGAAVLGVPGVKAERKKANPFAVLSVVLKWQGEPEKVFGMSAKPRPIFPCGKMPENLQRDARPWRWRHISSRMPGRGTISDDCQQFG